MQAMVGQSIGIASDSRSFSGKLGKTAAFLGGALLAAFAGVADISHAQNSEEFQLSTEDVMKLEFYSTIESLREKQDGEMGITGLHELAESGTLGFLSLELTSQLEPSDLGIADKKGRRVADQWIGSHQVPFANPVMKKLLYLYSDSLDAKGQRRIAMLAMDHGIFGAVSIGKLEPRDIVEPVSVSVSGAYSEGRSRTITPNLLLDSLRCRQFDERMKYLAGALTDEQRAQAAKAVDENGGTIGHYMAQDVLSGSNLVDVEMLRAWRDHIDWEARDVTGTTPLQILSARPDVADAVFAPDEPERIPLLPLLQMN